MVAAIIYYISYATQNMTLMLFSWRDEVYVPTLQFGCASNSFVTNNAAKLMLHDFQGLLRKGDATCHVLEPWPAL